MWTKTERNGKIDQAKGKVKQAVGTLTRKDDLKAEGQVDETVGKVEAAVGRTSRKAGDAITRVGKAVKR
jgi:uncharacterized protein YjbJ (UPF0337 family)